MTKDSTDPTGRGAAADPLIRAMGGLEQALARLARRPWSRRRREALIVALNTVLVLHLDAVARAVSGEIARLEVQQGRLTKQLADLEARVSRLEGTRERERGG